MNAHSLPTEKLESVFLPLLESIETANLDRTRDQLMTLAIERNSVSLSSIDDQAIRLTTDDGESVDWKTPRAMSILRMLCARLAVRAGHTSVYGGTVEIESAISNHRFAITFRNKPQAIQLRIASVMQSSQSANGALKEIPARSGFTERADH